MKRLFITNRPVSNTMSNIVLPGDPWPIRVEWVAFWNEEMEIPELHGTGRTIEDAINDLFLPEQAEAMEEWKGESEENSAEGSG